MTSLIRTFNTILSKKLIGLTTPKAFPIFLFIVGVIMRLKHYLGNRSLWMDEAYLSSDIANMPLMQLATFQTMFPEQARQPAGFLIISKLSTLLFGISEYSLRLLPLSTSLLSLVLVYVLVKKILGRKEALWALGIFALAEPMIYYAAEVKPYSCDLLISLILFIVSTEVLSREVNKAAIWTLSLLGICAIWLSNASLLILPTITLLLFYKIQRSKDKNLKITFFLCTALLFTHFLIIYTNSISKMLENKDLINISLPVFIPRPIFTSSSFAWLLNRFIGIFEHCLGLGFGAILLAISIIGCFRFFRKNRMLGSLFGLPIVSFLIANALQKYPFHYRTSFFLTPCVTIFLVCGVTFIFGKIKHQYLVVKILIFALLLGSSLSSSIPPFLRSHNKFDTRPLLQYLKTQRQKGDALIYNNSAQYAYGFYHGLLGMGSARELILKLEDGNKEHAPTVLRTAHEYLIFNRQGYFIGNYDTMMTQALLRQEKGTFLNNQRTWLFLTQLQTQQQQRTVEFFKKRGGLIIEKKAAGAWLYLFNMQN